MNAAQLQELEGLKKTLRCLVLSSATVTNVRSLSRDFMSMEGERIPHTKFGYTSLLTFLKERCNDCLLFSGDPNNPIITPVVTERTKHINDLISKQKIPNTAKVKQKRTSVLESQLPSSFRNDKNTYYNSRSEQNKPSQSYLHSTSRSSIEYEIDPNWTIKKSNKTELKVVEVPKQDNQYEQNKCRTPTPQINTEALRAPVNGKEKPQRPIVKTLSDKLTLTSPLSVSNDGRNGATPKKIEPSPSQGTARRIMKSNANTPSNVEPLERPMATLSLTSRYNILYLNNTKSQIEELMDEHPYGVWLEDLDELYKYKFEDGIDYSRLGYCDLASFCRDLPDTVKLDSSSAPGKLIVFGVEHSGPFELSPKRPAGPMTRSCRSLHRASELELSGDSDDALPGVPYDEGIFPEDCMGHRESIPLVSLRSLEVGGLCEVNVSEVLDPSHFWFQLRSSEHDLALEKVMDEMTEYYNDGEGRDRMMEFGAVQVGQYCATNYHPDGWHRCVIVQIIDLDYVKVRHIDYGTVVRVARGELRVLPHRWAALPAQALRGCLANLRPSAGRACWPYKTAVRFQAMVNCVPLVAQVHSIDETYNIVRLYLTDTTKEEDLYLSNILVTEGHAVICDMHRDILEGFLLPSFEDVESGEAMNLTEKAALVAAGASPDGLETDVSLPVRIRKQESVQTACNPQTQYTPSYNTDLNICDTGSSNSISTYTNSDSFVSTTTLNPEAPGFHPGGVGSTYHINRSPQRNHPVFASYRRKIALVKPNSNAQNQHMNSQMSAPHIGIVSPQHNQTSNTHTEQYQNFTMYCNVDPRQHNMSNFASCGNLAPVTYSVGLSPPGLPQGFSTPPGFHPMSNQRFTNNCYDPHYSHVMQPSPQHVSPPAAHNVQESDVALQVIRNMLSLTETEMEMFVNTQRTNPEIAKRFLEERFAMFHQKMP